MQNQLIKGSENKELFCQFETDLQQYAPIIDTKVKISLEITDRQLQNIVHKLLQLKDTTSFDFIINGEIVRGALKDYVQEDTYKSENTLLIKFVPRIKTPQVKNTAQKENSVKKIYLNKSILKNYEFQVLDFNGGVMKLNSDLQIINKNNLNNKYYNEPFEILSSELIQNPEEDIWLVSDNFGNVFNFFQDNKSNEQTQTNIQPECETVFSILAMPLVNQIFLGDSEGKILSLQMSEKYTSIKEIKGVAQFSQMAIENLILKDENSLIMSSRENCIKIIDTNQLLSVQDLFFKSQQATSIDFSNRNSFLLAGFANGQVSIYDIRDKNKQIGQTFRGGSSYISQVKLNKNDQNQFISTDYLGFVYLFDTRSSRPVYQADYSDHGKIFSAEWSADNEFILGFENGLIQRQYLS